MIRHKTVCKQSNSIMEIFRLLWHTLKGATFQVERYFLFLRDIWIRKSIFEIPKKNFVVLCIKKYISFFNTPVVNVVNSIINVCLNDMLRRHISSIALKVAPCKYYTRVSKEELPQKRKL